MKTPEFETRMGTQRARFRSPSVEIYRSCVPLAHGLNTGFRECRGLLTRAMGPANPVSRSLLTTLTSSAVRSRCETPARQGSSASEPHNALYSPCPTSAPASNPESF